MGYLSCSTVKQQLVKWLTHGLGYLLIIDHTDVNDQFRGQGLGRKLLNELVTFARGRNIKVIPLCPFAKSFFDKDLSILDVLKI